MVEAGKLTDFLHGEFIGRKIRVVESSNRDLIGIEGKIVDETKNMFEIETEKGIKRVQKKVCKFLFEEEGIRVDGSIINYRPEDRLNVKFRDW